MGLMTGDVTIKPEASCLVMTTEILQLHALQWQPDSQRGASFLPPLRSYQYVIMGHSSEKMPL